MSERIWIVSRVSLTDSKAVAWPAIARSKVEARKLLIEGRFDNEESAREWLGWDSLPRSMNLLAQALSDKDSGIWFQVDVFDAATGRALSVPYE